MNGKKAKLLRKQAGEYDEIIKKESVRLHNGNGFQIVTDGVAYRQNKILKKLYKQDKLKVEGAIKKRVQAEKKL